MSTHPMMILGPNVQVDAIRYDETDDTIVIPTAVEIYVEGTGAYALAELPGVFLAEGLRRMQREERIRYIETTMTQTARDRLTERCVDQYVDAMMTVVKATDLGALIGPRMPLALMHPMGTA